MFVRSDCGDLQKRRLLDANYSQWMTVRGLTGSGLQSVMPIRCEHGEGDG